MTQRPLAASPRRVAASWRRPRRGEQEEANLMLLSGILITVAFIVTALTLAQVSSLERQAAAETPEVLSSEWRFVHDRVAANVNVSVADDTKNDTFANTTFPAIAETFRSVEAEKGYDIVLRLANASQPVRITEGNLLDASGTHYSNYSMDGRIYYSSAYDGKNDGMIFGACPDGTLPGCIIGVLVYVHLSDGSSTVEESLLIPTNEG